MTKRVFKPKIDTLPLSIASRDAPNKQERKLCMDLAFDIVEGNPRAQRFMDSGEAAEVLCTKSYEALRKVLRNAWNYEIEKKRQSVVVSDEDSNQESCENEPKRQKKESPSCDANGSFPLLRKRL